MATNPQLITARNRANAAHSTGPKTEAGKRRSSLNGMRHGLTGHTIILPSEDLHAYRRSRSTSSTPSASSKRHSSNRSPTHGARLTRQFREDLQQLRALQAERRAAEASQPPQNKTLPKSGFVFPSTPAHLPVAAEIGPRIYNPPDEATARCT